MIHKHNPRPKSTDLSEVHQRKLEQREIKLDLQEAKYRSLTGRKLIKAVTNNRTGMYQGGYDDVLTFGFKLTSHINNTFIGRPASGVFRMQDGVFTCD